MARRTPVLPLLVAALLAVVACAAPASAHHRPWHEADAPTGGAYDDGDWSDEDEDDWSDEDDQGGQVWDDTGDQAGGTDDGVFPLPEVDDGQGTEQDAGGGLLTDPVESLLPKLVTGRTVAGKVARMRKDGKAAVPRGAPKRVRQMIAAANQIVGKPYKWGGGHASIVDRGYDCSGAVSYALIRTGLLNAPRVSGSLARWGSGGTGRWVSVYANKGHVYMEIAGLRLDTSPVGDPSGRKGVRWRPVIGKRRGFSTRHPVGL
ncbi:NlpC/P60 family protein [Conexibacter sp. SYSU D00693]|uniref:NlpC/P60 family protein n=1 Tax=Conexibacter sp. SYSU D00693 TaxID=2812560 RepID=UPI00196ABDA0|nr:NlpC/P60 family protein [Conexibacter sp. SYSU D00693]